VDLYADDDRTKKLATFYFLRQQMQKPSGQFNHCLADYVAPTETDHGAQLQDYLGGFAVSIHGADELSEEFKRQHDDYSAIMAEVIGPDGHLIAVEVDSELAALARSNLRDVSQVRVLEADGGGIEPIPSDAILVNAGATHPCATWSDSLRPGGRLILPLTVSND